VGERVLDVGTGSGFIAASLAERVGPAGSVVAVDVVEKRQVSDGFEFTPVAGTTLPFPDQSFDIVLSNHLFEHVGGTDDTLHHLREVARVLRDGGVCYLAVTNRYVVIEPHFHLPFLSWLPAALRTPYVRLFRGGRAYDCDLPSRSDVLALLASAGLAYDELTLAAIDELRRVEGGTPAVRLARRLPTAILRRALPLIPTMVFLLRRAPSTG
jgi:SAM-dependent methyltransferase